jgi:hypothetical protein
MQSINIHYLIIIHLFIYSIKSRFLVNFGVAAAKVFVHGRAAVAAAVEEADIEAAAEEISGDLEFWDKSEITRGRLLFICSKISAAVLNYITVL